MVGASVLVMCVLVCLGMCPRAAFTSAARAVSRASQVEQPDLDLRGPERSCPVAFDDEADVPSTSLEDLSVSDISAPASFLLLTFGAPSAERERFRQEARSAL